MVHYVVFAHNCRSIIEPVRNSKFRQEANYHLAKAVKLDCDKQTVECVNSINPSQGSYELHYDKLVIGVGAQANTFNVPGVEEHAFFLKVDILLKCCLMILKKMLYCEYRWLIYLCLVL